MLKRPIFAVVGLSVIALSLFLMFHKIEVTAPVGGLIAFGFLLVIFPHLPPLKFGLGKDGVTFETLAPASDREDVMPGTYGASPSANGRRLQASVTRLGSSELAKVRLKVSPEQGARPLSGTVTFHLHPTFAPQNHPTVPVNVHGRAELEITSYGAFIAGASTDEGATGLEIDLAKAPGAFKPWLDR